MSWFDECTLTYEEIEQIVFYLKFLRVITNVLFQDPIKDLIDKLEEWLRKE